MPGEAVNIWLTAALTFVFDVISKTDRGTSVVAAPADPDLKVAEQEGLPSWFANRALLARFAAINSICSSLRAMLPHQCR